MSHSASPLRYPGGKAKLTNVLQAIIDENFREKPTYIEPFAGGAGAALNLLFKGSVDNIILNDADIRIFSFWKSVLEQNQEFIELIQKTEINIKNWDKFRACYLNPADHSTLDLGFATFYLNRCNRSGILPNGGPIGGRTQTSNWKIDARFNKPPLIERIKKVGNWSEKINIYNIDAIEFIKNREINYKKNNDFYYIDPPYYNKGGRLYLNFYNKSDHHALSECIKEIYNSRWLLSYDNTSYIKSLYKNQKIQEYVLNYSASITKNGKEIIISEPDLKIPNLTKKRRKL